MNAAEGPLPRRQRIHAAFSGEEMHGCNNKNVHAAQAWHMSDEKVSFLYMAGLFTTGTIQCRVNQPSFHQQI